MTHLQFAHSGETVQYRSRHARKGRYALRTHTVQPVSPDEEKAAPNHIQARVGRLESEFKPHFRPDISFWLAVIFVSGSAVWVANGFTVLLPLYLEYISSSESLTSTWFKAAAALAFIGGTLFEVGSYLMIVEAINRAREHNFNKTGRLPPHTEGFAIAQRKATPPSDIRRKPEFVWWGRPIWNDLGYIAAAIQFFAATIFWVSTITGLPGVISGFPSGGSRAIIDVFFWTPQVIGGIGFTASSLVLMIEVQKRWFLPNPTDLGWQIGFWNLVGSIGFLLCGAMGYSLSERWVTNSTVSTFWGSCAFLIGSLMQLYEAVWREPESTGS